MKNPVIYLLLWAIEGPAQGCILTITVTVMSNWFSSSERGKVMGLWGSNASAGNILGEWVAAVVHESMGMPWQAVILVSSSLLGLIGLTVYFAIDSKPRLLQSAVPLLAPPQVPALNFWDAWREPGVTFCALAYACVKLLNYGFMMWLPYYLAIVHRLYIAEIGLLCTLYDLGGISGSILAGYLSDKVKFRSLIVEVMICLAIPIVLLFRATTTEEKWAFYVLVPAAGVMIGGSANIISAAIAADLSICKETKKPRATIVGIINGTGSLGAASGQILVRDM